MPISALEHYSYCPRQCALIHVEQTYEENIFTIRGRFAHERVESERSSEKGDVLVVRGVPLWSDRLRLRGKADVVEIHAEGPYPVEYKLGRRRAAHADLQLCAQALCLEEMVGTPIPRGAVFQWETRRRHEVTFDRALRERTERMVETIRETLQRQRLPDAPNDRRCPNCSLIEACLPSVIAGRARLRGLQGALFHAY